MLNPLGFISKFIKSSNQKELDRLQKIVKQVNAYEEHMIKLEDKEFPKKTEELKNKIKKGDPYQWQVEQTVKEIMSKLRNKNLDHVISYQSRVGPMKWIGPSTDAEIIKYSREKKGIVIVPVAFVSEHSETLVELDIEYKKLAEKNGCSFYKRVPALGTEDNFIKGLTELVIKQQTRGNFVSSIMCPDKYIKCPCLGL